MDVLETWPIHSAHRVPQNTAETSTVAPIFLPQCIPFTSDLLQCTLPPIVGQIPAGHNVLPRLSADFIDAAIDSLRTNRKAKATVHFVLASH